MGSSKPSERPALSVRIAGYGALLILAACSGNKAPSAADPLAAKNAAALAAAKQRAGTTADQTATMVQAPTSGKATAPMLLKYEIAQRPIAGQTVDISLALLASAAAPSVTLHLADSPGIVFATTADRAIGAVVPDTVYRQDLQLSAAAEGVYFVGITATMTRDTLTETRNFSIPIIVSAQ
jgi:hypothetical protein